VNLGSDSQQVHSYHTQKLQPFVARIFLQATHISCHLSQQHWNNLPL